MPEHPATIEERLLTVKEAAELLRVSVRFINQRFSTGVLERVKLGRATRVRLSDVLRVTREGTA